MSSIPMFIRYPPPVVIPTLEQVLISGNSAGTNNINMNNQNILNVDNINTMTINNLPYPPLEKNTKTQTFLDNNSSPWTIPTGTTYITAYILAGGGALANTANNNTLAGSDSSLTYNSIIYTAKGGNGIGVESLTSFSIDFSSGADGANNSGKGASMYFLSTETVGPATGVVAQDGQLLIQGFDIIPGQTILTYSIGSGGSGGSDGLANGGSGMITLFYY